ncbi:Rne/Rng family ribonuclease [Azotosporobacter soli]|uniref:Rne/Rng family ribonuclease n=1 Tax=Azotosporobacter soli TaxID=3055040 RepID=UPI0031FF3018
MDKEILVNVTPEETRMALLEGGRLAELVLERNAGSSPVGCVYKGRIKNVLPGMQAVFVDIGRDKNAFLYIGDQELSAFSVGREVLLQVVKDAIGSKGPRATTNLTLPGRYVVLLPTGDHVAISRRIESEEERERLRLLAEAACPEGMGMIVRTVADGCQGDELRNDVAYLKNLWQTLQARAQIAQAPTLLYRDVDLAIRIVRDHLARDVDQLIVDHRETHSRMVELLRFSDPELAKRVVLYEGGADLFLSRGLEEEMSQLSQREVPLRCGGYLVIDHTEALTVIDVNTGRFTGDTSLADTVFRTNQEAAAEIARQLRLRDIGGIIIVDFIDMEGEEKQHAVLEILNGYLRQDRTRANVLGFTSLGLVEITRKKARQNAENLQHRSCPCCQGRGRVQSPETVVIQIWRRLRQLKGRRGKLLLQVHPDVAEHLRLKDSVRQMEQSMGVSLRLEGDAKLHPEVFLLLAEQD